MADIVLVITGRVYVEQEVFQMESPFLSFGASVLEKYGYDVKVLDFYLNFDKYTVQDIVKEKPKLILVYTVTSGYEWEPTYELLQEIRGTETLKTSHLGLWIFHPNAFHDLLLEGFIDSIYLGNIGEAKSLVNYTQCVLERNLSDAPATVFTLNNQIKVNAPLPLSTLDELNNLPYYKHYYLDELKARNQPLGEELAVIRSSYGCHGRCTFCKVQAFSDYYDRYKWRSLSPERVVAEIEDTYNKYGIKYFYFADPLFIGAGKRGKEIARRFAELIIAKKIDIKFFIYARADGVDKDTLSILKKAGLTTIVLGIESLSQSQLNRYSKGTKVTKNIEAIDICKELDIYMQPGFILFDAYTTIEELQENVKNLKEVCKEKSYLFSKPDRLIGGILNAFEGTEVFEDYKREGLLLQGKFNDLDVMNKAEKLGISRNANEAFYFKDDRISTIAHACGLVRGEIGRQMFLAQKYRRECIEELKLSPNNKEKKLELNNLVLWNNYIGSFTIEALGFIVDELSYVDNHWLDQFKVLDKVWDNFQKYNSHFLGASRSKIHSLDRYEAIKKRELQLLNN